MGGNFNCMEIGEEGKASGEFNEDWTKSGTVDFDVNNSRRKKVELRDAWSYCFLTYWTYWAREGSWMVTMLSCLRSSFAKCFVGFCSHRQQDITVWSSSRSPTRMPGYTSTRCHRHGRKTRLKLWHTVESERNVSLRKTAVFGADKTVGIVAGKWDKISRKSSSGRAAKPWKFALLSRLYWLGLQTKSSFVTVNCNGD